MGVLGDAGMIPPFLRRLALALLLALALVAGAAADPFEVATYADWDIATVQNHGSEVWYIADEEDYPGLAWADMPPYDTSVSHYRGARGDKFGSGRYAPEGPETGSLAWTYQTGDPIKNSPVVGPNGNIVFRGASGTVYCISPDGNLVWTHASPGDDYIKGSVGIDNSGNIYFGYRSSYDFPDPTSPGNYSPPGGYLCSLASDGSVRWQTDRLNNGFLAYQSPVIQNGMVYIVPSSNVLAFNCADGSLVWASGYSWQTGYGASVGKDGAIIVTPAQTNRLMSLDPLTGSLNWQAALTYPIDAMYVYSGLPTISPETGVIYIPGEHFRADEVFERYYVINAIGPDGTRLWETAEDPSSAPSKYASLAVGLLAVYSVWEDGSLRAHDLSTGEQLWSLPGSFYGGAHPSPVLDGADTVYIGGTDGYFYAIASDGSEKWKHNIGSEYINSATIGNDGTVYVTTQSGDLYAFSAPPLVAAFSAAPTTGTAPLTVSFTDESTGATLWSWNFGDGGTSDQQHPSHTYNEPGTYTVALTVTNAGGSDTETKTGHITVTAPVLPPVAEFWASPTTGTAPLTVQFTDASTNAPTARSWNFGDGRTSIAQSPSHTYSTAGTYTVALTVTNAGGSDTETKTGYITVSAPPPTAPPTAANSPAFPYSQQRKETLSFLLMCWGALAFVGVFCVVIFLLMNGAQRGSGGI